MKKKFSLQNMELAEAAVKDAVNFGLVAEIEQNDGEISIAYEAPETEKEDCACCAEDVYKICQSILSSCSYELKWLREDINYVRDSFYKHVNNGHIPAILDSGLMKKALKSLGLEESFEVKVPAVYVQY